ncbi:hypothetical protein EZV62_007249 [Acer yangbiense]|uniref:Serine/threonine-protein kinase BSK1-like TPR repeats domain-containing protein n=1 Tax=Acer yangbiense TaxID=1000413 RepID=A0A5C7I9W2_9ROSI|nr:hypothetical protein EZV62_007249 [Acer yangbiense]
MSSLDDSDSEDLQRMPLAPTLWKNKKRLSKQLSMCETPRDRAWERRRRQILLQERRRNGIHDHDHDHDQLDLTDEDLHELKGCIELGFGFNEEKGQQLCNTLPALDLYFAVNRQVSSPVSTPQSGRASTSSLGTRSSSFGSPRSESDSWKICSPGDNPQQVKTKLRHWAQAVACSGFTMAPDASHALAVRDKVQQFLNAACTGNLDLLKKIATQLDGGKGLASTVADIKDANKRGALHFAAREGKTEVCKYLLEELKLDADTEDEDGETPILHAARQGHTETAKYLFEHGANPAIASSLGATALHHSAGIGNIELLTYLLSKGVEVDSQSDSGTPLIWAAGHGQPEAVKVLLEHNANPDSETEDNITPLLSAVAAGSLTCLDLLVQAGAKVNITAGGATPLHIAADIGSIEIIKCLLKAGADPNITDEAFTLPSPFNPLYTTAKHSYFIFFKDGQKPILVAAARGNREVVEILFPLTSKIQTITEWTVDGILEHMQSETNKQQEEMRNLREDNVPKNTRPENDLPKVAPEIKKKAAEAKSRGDEAFKRNDCQAAIDAYTQAIDLDPYDATLLSNRSLCWIRLGQAEHALADAKACRALRPDWPKACYREGAALRLLQACNHLLFEILNFKTGTCFTLFDTFQLLFVQKFDEAANAFYEGVVLDPENKEIVNAFREAVEAGKKFHGTDKVKQ